MEKETATFRASRLDLFFLGEPPPALHQHIDSPAVGITIVIGGQYFAWNHGLQDGFPEFMAGTLLMGFAYLVLVLCLAEMTSTLPFSGGTYGFVRVALGPYAGFLVGNCESMLNVLYIATAVVSLGEMITAVTALPSAVEPLYWVLFFLSTGCLNLLGQHAFWNTNAVLAILSISFLLFYMLLTASTADFHRYAMSEGSGVSVRDTFRHMPWASWFFVGIEMLPLTSRECDEPRKDVPAAMVSCMVFLLVTAVGVLFSASSQSPGIDILSASDMPLNYGFSRVLRIPWFTATWFSLPATYATSFGFIYSYSRQINSMHLSGLLPRWLPSADSKYHLHAYLCSVSVLALLVLFLDFFCKAVTAERIFMVAILGGYIVYILLLVSYIVFATKFSSLQREYESPLGIVGAVLAMAVFGAAAFSAALMQGRIVTGMLVLIAIIGMTVLYYAHIRHYQCFSPEEQKILFAAYVINGIQPSFALSFCADPPTFAANKRSKEKIRSKRTSFSTSPRKARSARFFSDISASLRGSKHSDTGRPSEQSVMGSDALTAPGCLSQDVDMGAGIAPEERDSREYGVIEHMGVIEDDPASEPEPVDPPVRASFMEVFPSASTSRDEMDNAAAVLCSESSEKSQIGEYQGSMIANMISSRAGSMRLSARWQIPGQKPAQKSLLRSSLENPKVHPDGRHRGSHSSSGSNSNLLVVQRPAPIIVHAPAGGHDEEDPPAMDGFIVRHQSFSIQYRSIMNKLNAISEQDHVYDI